MTTTTNIKNTKITNYSSLYADFCGMLNKYRSEHTNISPQCLGDIILFITLPTMHHERAMSYLCENYPLSVSRILHGDYSKQFEKLLPIIYKSMMSEAFPI